MKIARFFLIEMVVGKIVFVIRFIKMSVTDIIICEKWSSLERIKKK